jgi:hypothetical protein
VFSRIDFSDDDSLFIIYDSLLSTSVEDLLNLMEQTYLSIPKIIINGCDESDLAEKTEW